MPFVEREGGGTFEVGTFEVGLGMHPSYAPWRTFNVSAPVRN
jgi:hypothetical protein